MTRRKTINRSVVSKAGVSKQSSEGVVVSRELRSERQASSCEEVGIDSELRIGQYTFATNTSSSQAQATRVSQILINKLSNKTPGIHLAPFKSYASHFNQPINLLEFFLSKIATAYLKRMSCNTFFPTLQFSTIMFVCKLLRTEKRFGNFINKRVLLNIKDKAPV